VVFIWEKSEVKIYIRLLSKVPSPAIVTMAALSQWERVLGAKRKAGEGYSRDNF
jgi:hypothetical protein